MSYLGEGMEQTTQPTNQTSLTQNADTQALALDFIQQPFDNPEPERLLRFFSAIETAKKPELDLLAGTRVAALAAENLKVNSKRSLYVCFVLLFVRRAGLYKSEGTFETYCEKSTISPQTARNCIRRAEVGIAVLKSRPNLALPEHVAVVTALAKLPEEHIAPCWDHVLANAAGRVSDSYAKKAISAYCVTHGLTAERESVLNAHSIDCFDKFFPEEIISLYTTAKVGSQSLARDILDSMGRYGTELNCSTDVLKLVEEVRKHNRKEYNQLVMGLLGVLFGTMGQALKLERLTS